MGCSSSVEKERSTLPGSSPANQGPISPWNRGAETITGYRASDVLGVRCFDNLLRHVDDEGTSLCFCGCPLSAALQDGCPRSTEVFLHHRDGHRVPVRVRVAPIRDEAGAIVGALEVFTDESTRVAAIRRAEELERAHDFVGRWGGEEFLMLLANVEPSAVTAVAERARKLVEGSGFPVDGDTVRVTVSIGATLGQPDDTAEALVGRADALMYASKTAGRNRVTH